MTLPCTDSFQVIVRLQQSWNARDIDGLLLCYHPDYQSLQPFHPERNFSGLSKLRTSWCALFDSLSSFQAELKRCSVSGNTVWTEWHWQGCHLSGVLYESVGVMIFEIENERIARAHIYSEILTNEGPDWENVLNDLLDEQNDV